MVDLADQHQISLKRQYLKKSRSEGPSLDEPGHAGRLRDRWTIDRNDAVDRRTSNGRKPHMKLKKRVVVVATLVASGVGLFAAPAQAATLVSTFANSEAGGLFCHAVEGVFEERQAEAAGHPGDWYYCEQSPAKWSLYKR
ncbi:hypothetical protein ACTMTF_04850 [Nonomuraea sp. ZG12]|uniref:hypothetical protein n=1 Tax=Nonomuraea sp. ZG12 TaxID=3452207 RepID=UPI003F8C6051